MKDCTYILFMLIIGLMIFSISVEPLNIVQGINNQNQKQEVLKELQNLQNR